MRESLLRKTAFLFLMTTMICFLWAIGANSRKKVELEKSGDLDLKLDKLIKANTVIADDLKQATNKAAELKKSENATHKELKKIKEKNESLLQSLKDSQKAINKNASLEKEINYLKNTNTALGEELIKAKEKTVSLQQELKQLTIVLEQQQQLIQQGKKPIREKEEKIDKQPAENKKGNLNKNFAW